MAHENFLDYIRINCRSGHGGPGKVHFRRDRSNPKGGPDGGNGGRGGHIILRGDRNLWTLLHLRYKKHLIAADGEGGGQNQRTGADGKDVVVRVPLGTVAKDEISGEIDCEILEHDEEKILVLGGQGGMGNAQFKSSTRQTPKYAQPGLPGKDLWKVLELKILADVGLVGLPNAGKSTLLSVLSAATPKIGAYPFTTLKPNLGIVEYRDLQSFVMADIPGIIKGAHEGKGLGLRFLRHIERNAVLLFMIPCDSDDIVASYHLLVSELQAYNPELLDKPRVIAITKCDLLDEELTKLIKSSLPEELDFIMISAITRQGLVALKDMLWSAVTSESA